MSDLIKEIVEQHLIAYGCKVCGGGGTDDNNETCTNCKGLGIVDFETDYIVEKLEAHIKDEQNTLLDRLIQEQKTYSNVTYDFGTALVVSEVQAIPLSALIAEKES